jgi:pectinesterase
MALRTFATTRLKVLNCILKAYGGDTVSPWNVEEGMFYFKDCEIEGGVDFYCPRGWAYAENCKFYAHNGSAAIWHDGSKYEDSKTVLVNCYFDGFEGFKLGRWHRDAQFFLINCKFSKSILISPFTWLKQPIKYNGAVGNIIIIVLGKEVITIGLPTILKKQKMHPM